jgi:hypothetical protein
MLAALIREVIEGPNARVLHSPYARANALTRAFDYGLPGGATVQPRSRVCKPPKASQSHNQHGANVEFFVPIGKTAVAQVLTNDVCRSHIGWTGSDDRGWRQSSTCSPYCALRAAISTERVVMRTVSGRAAITYR